jgi:hypothetical protein
VIEYVPVQEPAVGLGARFPNAWRQTSRGVFWLPIVVMKSAPKPGHASWPPTFQVAAVAASKEIVAEPAFVAKTSDGLKDAFPNYGPVVL